MTLMTIDDSQWEMSQVGFSAIEWYWVNWCSIKPMDSTQFHLKNENGLKISRAKLSGIPSPRVQWCQEHYFWIYSIWLYQATVPFRLIWPGVWPVTLWTKFCIWPDWGGSVTLKKFGHVTFASLPEEPQTRAKMWSNFLMAKKIH